MDIPLTLHQLGFNKKEAQVYLAALELGMAPSSVVAKKVRMKRTSAYEILKKLSERGVAEFFMKKNTRYYSVISPKALLEKYQEHVYELESALPQLLAISNQIRNKPRISFYEGRDDLRRLYKDMLTSKGEILNYFLAEQAYEYFGSDWLNDVIQKRINAKIPVRVIMPDSPMATLLASKDVSISQLRNARVVPQKHFFFKNEIYIYGNKMTLFSFDDDLAFMVESPDVVQTQRAIFELAWLGAVAVSSL